MPRGIRIRIAHAKCILGKVREVPGFGKYSRQHGLFDCGRTDASNFRSCGGAVRQDVLVSADMDSSSEGESGHAAWLANRKAKKKEELVKRRDGETKKGMNEGKDKKGRDKVRGIKEKVTGKKVRRKKR